ncbi:hypothetical protein Dcar01_03563 [Deinococcus carri]|uniref:Uncharacterized protein n=1 Tax=Deinococcus carri TaxID=1211323 RepID=A0ABP9WBU5_9DEIO
MKRVAFEGEGDIVLTLQADFSNAGLGELGMVRVQAEGVDVEGDAAVTALVYGWYTPEEAREIARYLKEMADKAELGGPQ